MQMRNGRRILKAREAAQYLGLSESYLKRARLNACGPVYVKVGRAVRYLIDDLDTWLQRQRTPMKG
jgi:predicted DNA-binding transcriptional regulator AlpA